MTPDQITEILVAVAGLIAAVTGLVSAFRNVHTRIDDVQNEVTHLTKRIDGA